MSTCIFRYMIVRKQLVQFWITKEVFIPVQFGFLKGKSCLSQLLSSFHDWARKRNKGLTTDVILLDLSKAFDSVTVAHKRLLTTIRSYGIQGSLLSWLRCFHKSIPARRSAGTSLILDSRFVWCTSRSRVGAHFISHLY